MGNVAEVILKNVLQYRTRPIRTGAAVVEAIGMCVLPTTDGIFQSPAAVFGDQTCAFFHQLVHCRGLNFGRAQEGMNLFVKFILWKRG